MRIAALMSFGVIAMLNGAGVAFAQTLAFPGAQGFGRFATGGRGGSVYYVTTTNDTGAGSFRDAVSQPNRTVVFAVSGVIDYQSPRYNIQNNVTIAGQTAPGDGVVLYGDGIGFTGSDNSITRFIRFRMGHTAVGEDTVGIANGHDMIFDHISATWSLDEVFSISGSPEPSNITIQSSIIGQGLEDHSAGGLIQTDGGVSILRCLYIDNGTRNPKVKGVNEFVNNVVYNWRTAGYILGGESSGESFANVIGNYFINGPGSGGGCFADGNANFHLFATNNWQDNNRNGALDGFLLSQGNYDQNTWETTPFAYPIAVSNALPPLTAVKLAVSDVGPSWRRDTVDGQLINELTSWGTLGEYLFSEFEPPMNGPGPYKGGPVPLDSDVDGMPNYWEAGLGLNPNDASDRNLTSTLGYTRLEDYLDWLAEPHGVALTNTVVHIDLRQFTRGFANLSPVYSISGASNGTATLTNGFLVRFVPTAGFIGQAGFSFSVNDSQGSTLARTMGLFFTPQPPGYGRVWRGDGVANNWNVLGDANWFDDQALLYPFANGNSVEFDDTGSTNPAVNLAGSVQPGAVAFNSTKSYTLSGSGSLDGAMTLTKSGTGTLVLANTNNFAGPTTVSNGTLLVNGSLNQSVVSIRSGGMLGGNGQIGVAPVLQSGAVLAPGNGVGSPGLLTISNALTFSGGVSSRFDLSDDPSGVSKTNDRIQVIGNLNLSGANVLQVNLLDGPLANGLYTLITYSNLSGSFGSLSLVGANGILTNPPGAIAIYVNNTRPSTNLVWSGNGANNNWDNGTTPTWMNSALPDWFYFGDTVRFDDAGSTNPAVNLVGAVTPESVTVDATKNHTLSGAGKISGTGGLTKTNSGTLKIATTNDYTGVSRIAGGVLSLSQFASNAPSAIGAATTNTANLIVQNGATLRYTGANGTTERGLTLGAGGGAMDVTNSSTVLTWSGLIVGSGALTKTGLGRLDVTAPNTYSGGTMVNAGDVRLVNTDGFGTGTITLNGTGANAATFRFVADAQTVPNKILVTGTNNVVLIQGNNTLSQLEGSGTLTGGLVTSGTTLTFGSSMSAFTGTFRVGTVSNPRLHGSTGSSSATFDLGTGSAKLNTRNGGFTGDLGALIGGPNTILEGASSANSVTTYSIGGKNLDTKFAGKIQEVIPARTVNITKVGTGVLTLTGINTYTGPTVVNGGTLLVCNPSGTGTGTNSVTVNGGGTLGGSGFILGLVIVSSGGTLAPGSNTVGTLTINSNLTLGGNLAVEVNKSASPSNDRCVVSGTLTNSGSGFLAVANLGPALALGDSFTLFNKPLQNAGALTITPAPGPGLAWTNKLAIDGTIAVVTNGPSNYTERLYAVTTGNQLIAFQSSAPGVILSAVAFTGLQSSEQIVGVDFVGETLYAVGSSARLYTINRVTGAATLMGAFTPALNGVAYGVEAEPAGVRVVSELDQHLVLNLGNGAATVGTTLIGSPNPSVSGLAYHPGTGQRYVADYVQNTIGTLDPANGLVTPIGLTGLDFSRNNGFDISGKPAYGAYMATPSASADPAANLYTVNLATGAASLVGHIGGVGDSYLIRGLAVGPEFSTTAAVNSNPANLIWVVTGGTNLTLAWPTDHLGWTLQCQTNNLSTGLSANWADVAGSASLTTTNFPLNPANPTVFYRLRLAVP